MTRPAILLALLFCVMSSVLACCGQPHADPTPTKDLKELIDRRTDQWLDVRMDSTTWDIYHKGEPQWGVSTSVAQIEQWIALNLGQATGLPVVWDFSSFIKEIKASELYARGPPSEADFLGMVVDALKAYQYRGDE